MVATVLMSYVQSGRFKFLHVYLHLEFGHNQNLSSVIFFIFLHLKAIKSCKFKFQRKSTKIL